MICYRTNVASTAEPTGYSCEQTWELGRVTVPATTAVRDERAGVDEGARWPGVTDRTTLTTAGMFHRLTGTHYYLCTPPRYICMCGGAANIAVYAMYC